MLRKGYLGLRSFSQLGNYGAALANHGRAQHLREEGESGNASMHEVVDERWLIDRIMT